MNKSNFSTNNDAAYYWSLCILRRLRDMNLISQEEYTKIQRLSAEQHDTQLLCV